VVEFAQRMTDSHDRLLDREGPDSTSGGRKQGYRTSKDRHWRPSWTLQPSRPDLLTARRLSFESSVDLGVEHGRRLPAPFSRISSRSMHCQTLTRRT
jgi:hypothetical protein